MDLLEQSQAALDKAALPRMIKDRHVVITGAGGSIGSELTQQVAALGPAKIVMLENSEYNLYAIDLELVEKYPDISAKPISATSARRRGSTKSSTVTSPSSASALRR